MKKRERIENMLSLIDDSFIEEANPTSPFVRKRDESRRLKGSTLAMIISSALLVLIVCFIPFFFRGSADTPPVNSGTSSGNLNTDTPQSRPQGNTGTFSGEYTPIIEGLDKLFTSGNAVQNPKEYSDTDISVQGVTRGDVLLKGSKYLYYLNGVSLQIYTLDGEKSQIVGLFSLEKTLEFIGSSLNSVEGVSVSGVETKFEIFLSADEKTVTVVGSSKEKYKRPCVSVISLDVSDPSAVSVKRTVNILGNYVTSRLVGDEVLVFTSYAAGSNEKGYIPQIDKGSGFEYLPADKITYPEDINSPRYLVASRINVSTLKVNDTVAYLSYSTLLHVTGKNVFLTHTIESVSVSGDIITKEIQTELSCLGIDTASFTRRGSVVIDGYAEGESAFLQSGSKLAMITTSSLWQLNTKTNEQSQKYLLNAYLIELLSLTPTSEAQGFAEADNSGVTVRFKNGIGYAYIEENGEESVYMLTFTSAGVSCEKTTLSQVYSSNLVEFKGNYLLGYDKASMTIKLYEASERGIESIAQYTLDGKEICSDYRAIYINKEIGVIGIGYTDSEGQGGYLLLGYNGINFVEIINISIDGANESKRAVYKDGYIYIISEKQLVVRYIENKLISGL